MIYAKPYDFTESVEKNIAIVDGLLGQPDLLPLPLEPDVARGVWQAILTDPGQIIYEVWRDQEIVGVVWLARIVPRVDALLRFAFFDKDLVGKRKLLQNFIGFCFRELGLNRLSMEVPEGIRLERFCRKVLRFRLEGEIRPRNPELPRSLSDNWVARQGSRRECAHFDGKAWKDVVLLRLLASEWVGTGGGDESVDRGSAPTGGRESSK